MNTNEWLGRMVKDRRTGVSGRVIGYTEWEGTGPTLVVQPPARADATVPPTVSVQPSMAEVVPQPMEPRMLQ